LWKTGNPQREKTTGPTAKGFMAGRRPKPRPNQHDEIVTMVSTGAKTAADAARRFGVHPATVSRILPGTGVGMIGLAA
jgi:hypothetical protein